MAQYTRRKDGRYASFVDNGRDAETGQRIRIPVYGYSIAELEDNKAAVRDALNKGTYANDKGYTVGKWVREFVEVYKTGVVESTLNDYNNIIKNHLTCIEDIRLQDLKKSDVQRCLNQASKYVDIPRRIKILLNAALETAIDDGLLYKNVCRSIKVSAPASSNKTRALTDQERKALPNIDFTSKEKAFLYILWYTGMRPEEARGLMRSDIDLRNNIISVNRVVVYPDKNQAHIEPRSKSDAGIRTIPILTPLAAPLRDFLKEGVGLYLFSNSEGNVMSYSTYRNFCKRIYNKINLALGGTNDHIVKKKKVAGIKATDLTPYVFRHEYATILYYSGIDIKEAARLMGHESTKLILETYAELDAKKSNSTSKLESYLSNY